MTLDIARDSAAPAFASAGTAAPPLRPGTLKRLGPLLRREPLLHFCLLGGLLFAADAVLQRKKVDDKEIVVTKARLQEFSQSFDEDQERQPNDKELRAMADAWVASEILYREGKAMGVDRGDQMIRDRVAYKLQLMIFDQANVPDPTTEQLRAWFEKNHERWDKPPVASFLITPAVDEATARKQFADMQAGQEQADLAEQTRAIIDRPLTAVDKSLGQGFREALLKLPVGQWQVLQSTEGWHVVRLEEQRPGEQAKLEDVTEEVSRAYHVDETRRRAWEAVNRLKASYKVRWE